MNDSAPLPPVLIVGVDSPIGLTLIRELGRRGVPVHGLARSRRGVGLHSRYLAAGFIHPRRDAAMIEAIRRHADAHGIALLMAISEPDLLFLQERAEELPGMRLLLPPPDALHQVLDKAQTLELAQRLGLSIPPTRHPRSAEEAPEIARELPFPVVLKWADPQRAAPILAAHGIPLLKAEILATPEALAAALRRFQPAGLFPMVQGWVPGVGVGQSFYLWRGETRLFFQHRRLHEWPPEGGYSTLCESLPGDAFPELRRQSEALLRALGWEGAAMVEYRLDPATGRAALMEINGRFWGSLPLASHCGAAFGWMTYCCQGLERPPPEPASPPRAGVRCRFAFPELRRLVALFSRRRRADPLFEAHPWRDLATFLGQSLDPALTHYVWDREDAVPFWRDLEYALRSRLPGWREEGS
ncbi:MAG: carboxylate--amine ligase [Magnetococcales bacterium]|nr:carboxylate--amine ligase [Magnetococcales bacterium]